MSERGTHPMSKAREAAARAYDDTLWKFDPSVNPVARKALCVNAAIDAFLAALSEDGDLVERVATAISKSHSGYALTAMVLDLVYDRAACEAAARAAIATLKQDAGQ